MKHILLILAFCFSLLASAGAMERPNIIFMFSDDHACNAISAYPGGLFDKIAPTPNIDRIAREGMLFENSFCANSICGPSRANILTGKHSHLNGFLDNNSSHFDGLQQTFPQLLRNQGYQTAMIGKWHLHSNPVGFDFWRILPGQGSYYNPDFIEMDNSRKRYGGHCNDLVTDFGLKWLKEDRDQKKPFVAMIQFKAPHRNWSAAERHLNLFKGVTMPEPETLFDDYANRSKVLAEHAMGIDKHMYWGHDMKFHGENQFPEHFASGIPNAEYRRMNDTQKKAWDAVYEPENQKFLADLEAGNLSKKEILRWKYQRYVKDYLKSIASVDDSVGRILTYLDKSGLAKNTIVIYSSDQGFYLGEHGWYDKRWMFEESFEMPFVIRWPGTIKPGIQTKALIQNIDYGPTFLDVCGAKIPADMQGQSIAPILKNSGKAPADWRKAVYYTYYGEATHQVAAHDGIRTERYTLFYVPKYKEWQLFDNEKDPQQMKSVHNDPAYATVFKDLQGQYAQIKSAYRAHSAVLPVPRGGNWQKRHAAMNKKAHANKHDLLFIGDSITQAWEGGGKKVWETSYGKRKALNLGISGDRTEHVIWRLNHGNLRNQRAAKAAVIMIGTNNTGHSKQDPSETADGIARILSILRARCPQTKILLLGVFPRDPYPTDEKRKINVAINEIISKFDDGERVHFLDISEKFLDQNGHLTKDIMPDFLHLTPKGYGIWADAIEPKLKELGL
ncbi:MAG: sulfatase-like hydrolase/transferase [Roseibacillus sp.]|nr:sulfatase-like hydrolase/transferase [Roseibacillus sp.]